MSVTSTSARAGTLVRPAGKPTRGLRRLRLLCMALALGCAVALPFELGVVHAPSLASLPVVGKFFTPPPPAIVAVQNYPRTAVVGHTERFSVHLSNLPHALLTYVLRYPNGQNERATVRADARGYSSHTFRVTYYPHQWREAATIGVRDASGKLQAFLRFAIQQPK